MNYDCHRVTPHEHSAVSSERLLLASVAIVHFIVSQLCSLHLCQLLPLQAYTMVTVMSLVTRLLCDPFRLESRCLMVTSRRVPLRDRDWCV